MILKAVRYKFCGSIHKWDRVGISDGVHTLSIRHGGRVSCYENDVEVKPVDKVFDTLFKTLNKLSSIEPTVTKYCDYAVIEVWDL